MSQGRRHPEPYWDGPPPLQNGIHSTPHQLNGPTTYAPPPFPPPNNLYTNGREYPRQQYHKQPYISSVSLLNYRNGKPDHTSFPPQYIRQPPSPNDIEDLQSRIRNMLSDHDSPGQQATYPPRPSRSGSGGRSARGLYHSPPLHRGQPPVTRNTRSQGRDTSWDTCEDITAYALGIVKSLEIPNDERREKEEFCRELEEVVQRIRPCIRSFYF